MSFNAINGGGFELRIARTGLYSIEESHPDLFELISEEPSEVTDIEELPSLAPDDLRTASIRIDFADGRTLKGCRTPTPAHALRIVDLCESFSPGLIAGVYRRRGRVLLEQWVEGESLEESVPSLIDVQIAGELLGKIHSMESHGADPPYLPTVAQRLERVRTDLDRLCIRSLLSETQSEVAEALCASSTPETYSTGIIHGDFGPHSVVNDGTRLIAIGHARLGIEALDFDLARTWYRWPMTPDQQIAFLDGYGTQRDAGSFQKHFCFWAISVLTRSAISHVSQHTGCEDRSLNRLRSILECPDASFPPGSRVA